MNEENKSGNDVNCSDFLTCPTCKMQVDKKDLGERCPRCNSVILPKPCEGCKNVCR